MSCEYRYIFIHLPKTGGTSITDELCAKGYLHYPQAITSQQIYRNTNRREKLGKYAYHWPAREQKKLIGSQVWDRCFKFAFVRNPWDRLVSLYIYILQSEDFKRSNLKRYNEVKRMDAFKEFVKDLVRVSPATQKSRLVDAQGRYLVDYVGRTENLQNDFDIICDRIDIERVLISKKNKTNHHKYESYYDEETRTMAECIYREDVEEFGYQFKR